MGDLAGNELWYTNGSTAASQHDLNPGPNDSGPSDLITANFGSFFVADDGVNGRVLWIADNL
jgi:ELWxxDGT repeat protein